MVRGDKSAEKERGSCHLWTGSRMSRCNAVHESAWVGNAPRIADTNKKIGASGGSGLRIDGHVVVCATTYPALVAQLSGEKLDSIKLKGRRRPVKRNFIDVACAFKRRISMWPEPILFTQVRPRYPAALGLKWGPSIGRTCPTRIGAVRANRRRCHRSSHRASRRMPRSSSCGTRHRLAQQAGFLPGPGSSPLDGLGGRIERARVDALGIGAGENHLLVGHRVSVGGEGADLGTAGSPE